MSSQPTHCQQAGQDCSPWFLGAREGLQRCRLCAGTGVPASGLTRTLRPVRPEATAPSGRPSCQHPALVLGEMVVSAPLKPGPVRGCLHCPSIQSFQQTLKGVGHSPSWLPAHRLVDSPWAPGPPGGTRRLQERRGSRDSLRCSQGGFLEEGAAEKDTRGLLLLRHGVVFPMAARHRWSIS